MLIDVHRAITKEGFTLGALSIDGEGLCFTLEDTPRDIKVAGETRIPVGVYDLALRNVGGMTQKYAAKFGDMHKGMLWLQNVPNFEWVYIHYGNYAKDTDGCILVGDSADISNKMVGSSVDTYKEIYPRIATAILNGESVKVRVT